MDSSRTIPANVDAFATLCDVVGEAVLVLDEDQRIVSINAAAQRLLGHAPDSLQGAPAHSILHETNTGTLTARHGDLVVRDTLGCALRVRSQYAPPVLVFEPARRVQEIEQLKNELVSTVSHELKTPLAAIKAYTATLREHPQIYAEQRDEFLSVVEEQADRLTRVVDDMLLITRVEGGHLLRRRARVRAMHIIDEALLGVSYNPATHPIVLEVGDVDLSGDPERLRDLLRNLLENAVKYSPKGGAIVVRAQQDDHISQIEIEDRGVGISPEDLPYIYDRFFRAPSSAGDAEGSGLGLYIAGAIVRAHGGTISARSKVGEGTVFTVRLPVR